MGFAEVGPVRGLVVVVRFVAIGCWVGWSCVGYDERRTSFFGGCRKRCC